VQREAFGTTHARYTGAHLLQAQHKERFGKKKKVNSLQKHQPQTDSFKPFFAHIFTLRSCFLELAPSTIISTYRMHLFDTYLHETSLHQTFLHQTSL